MPRKKKTEDEEIEDLIEELDDEEVEDDEELEDEDEELEDEEDEEDDEEEDEDEEDEDADDEDEDEDPDEAPRARRSSRTKKSAPAKKKVVRSGIGTKELADAAGVDSRTLRMYLRSKGIEKSEGRYEWKSLNDPEAKSILRGLRDKEHKVVQKERLDNLKGKKTAAKKPVAKKTTRSKTAATKTTRRTRA